MNQWEQSPVCTTLGTVAGQLSSRPITDDTLLLAYVWLFVVLGTWSWHCRQSCSKEAGDHCHRLCQGKEGERSTDGRPNLRRRQRICWEVCPAKTDKGDWGIRYGKKQKVSSFCCLFGCIECLRWWCCSQCFQCLYVYYAASMTFCANMAEWLKVLLAVDKEHCSRQWSWFSEQIRCGRQQVSLTTY